MFADETFCEWFGIFLDLGLDFKDLTLVSNAQKLFFHLFGRNFVPFFCRSEKLKPEENRRKTDDPPIFLHQKAAMERPTWESLRNL